MNLRMFCYLWQGKKVAKTSQIMKKFLLVFMIASSAFSFSVRSQTLDETYEYIQRKLSRLKDCKTEPKQIFSVRNKKDGEMMLITTNTTYNANGEITHVVEETDYFYITDLLWYKYSSGSNPKFHIRFKESDDVRMHTMLHNLLKSDTKKFEGSTSNYVILYPCEDEEEMWRRIGKAFLHAKKLIEESDPFK